MKTLLKWIAKKIATPEKIKKTIQDANANLANKEASDRAAKIMGYGNDASELTALYLAAFSNDGKMDEEELAKVNAKAAELVDKYLSEAIIEAYIDKLFA